MELCSTSAYPPGDWKCLAPGSDGCVDGELEGLDVAVAPWWLGSVPALMGHLLLGIVEMEGEVAVDCVF